MHMEFCIRIDIVLDYTVKKPPNIIQIEKCKSLLDSTVKQITGVLD